MKHWVVMAITLFVTALLLILVLVVNLFELSEMYLEPLAITELPEYRISELGIFLKS